MNNKTNQQTNIKTNKNQQTNKTKIKNNKIVL